MASVATISSKGQIVIPAKLRKNLGLKVGGKIVIAQEGNRLVISSGAWDAIEALYGKYAGSPMEEDLIEDKRREREREDKKLEEA